MKEFFVLGFALFLSSAVYPSLVAAKVVTNGQKRDYTYTGYHVYHPVDIPGKARTGMDAILTAAHGLSKIKDEIGSEQANLESNLKAARKMTEIINEKINGAVKDTIKILNDATAKAKAKLQSVSQAAGALGAVEDNIEGKNDKKGEKVHDKPKKKAGKPKHGRTYIPLNPRQGADEAARSEIEESTKRSQVALDKAAEFLGKVENSMRQLQNEAHAIGVQQ